MSNDSCLLSVILVMKNSAAFVGAALESVIHQSRPPDEIIVVDGLSSDESVAIARSFQPAFPGLQVVSQSVPGLAAARNYGMALATGQLIAHMDHDDIWTPAKLERQVRHLEETPDCWAVVGHMVRFLEPGSKLSVQYNETNLGHPVAAFTPASLLARRALYERVGQFNPALLIACDLDLFVRIRDAGLRMDLLPDVVIHKRLHDSNISNRLSQYRTDTLAYLRASLNRRKAAADTGQAGVQDVNQSE